MTQTASAGRSGFGASSARAGRAAPSPAAARATRRTAIRMDGLMRRGPGARNGWSAHCISPPRHNLSLPGPHVGRGGRRVSEHSPKEPVMPSSCGRLLGVLMLGLVSVGPTRADTKPEPGVPELFNGKALTGWGYKTGETF